jgi:hypothetical protein
MQATTKSVIDKILEFSKSSRRNEWITVDGISIYVRNANRLLSIGGGYVPTLDLASISIEDKGQGIFTSILEALETSSGKTLFVENVLEDRFQEFFKKRSGWYVVNSYMEGPPCFCFYK